MDAVRLAWSGFGEMSARDLYAALALRQRVLVVEQASPYLDLDGEDLRAHHLVAAGDAGGDPVGYLRALGPPGEGLPASFGRVVVAPERRGGGLGAALVAEALRFLGERWPGSDVAIGAQAHLERFYAGFGFARAGEPYDDVGVAHVDMLLPRRGGAGLSAAPSPWPSPS
jgi:ElaA protein